MRITVLGATGTVGTRVVAEALARGHDVTATVRNPARAAGLPAAARIRTGDVTDRVDVARLATGQDTVVAAIRPGAGREDELLPMTRTVLAGLAGTGARLVIVGGAGSLTVPGTGGRLVVDDPALVTADFRDIAVAGVRQLAACQEADGVDWTYASPPAMLLPGDRTGSYRRGGDELLVDDAGISRISVEDFAVALVDEAENPAHPHTRSTVAY